MSSTRKVPIRVACLRANKIPKSHQVGLADNSIWSSSRCDSRKSTWAPQTHVTHHSHSSLCQAVTKAYDCSPHAYKIYTSPSAMPASREPFLPPSVAESCYLDFHHRLLIFLNHVFSSSIYSLFCFMFLWLAVQRCLSDKYIQILERALLFIDVKGRALQLSRNPWQPSARYQPPARRPTVFPVLIH